MASSRRSGLFVHTSQTRIEPCKRSIATKKQIPQLSFRVKYLDFWVRLASQRLSDSEMEAAAAAAATTVAARRWLSRAALLQILASDGVVESELEEIIASLPQLLNVETGEEQFFLSLSELLSIREEMRRTQSGRRLRRRRQ